MTGDPRQVASAIRSEVSRFVVGKGEAIDILLAAIVAEGHVLLEGPPGAAKTTLAKVFARSMGGEFRRLQFTPDLLPADVVGTKVFNQKDGTFSTRQGPIFANVILADELNRATPRTQSAMLEAMQEDQVTIEGETLKLPRPFVTIATQVPYGSPGTYPLTEVQLDRFAVKVSMGYSSMEEEKSIMSKIDSLDALEVRRQAQAEDVLSLIRAAKSIVVSERVTDYIARIVSNLRSDANVRVPPSTRASIWLYKMGRARALLDGRSYVLPDDVKALAGYVLSHRLILTPDAETEDLKPSKLIESAVAATPVPVE